MRKVGLLLLMAFACLGSKTQGIYQIWGASQAGGGNNIGVLFNTTDKGENFKINHQFKWDQLGISPVGELTELNGKFYGLTYSGGNNGSWGVIFEWDPVTNVYTKKIDLGSDVGYGGWFDQKLAVFNGKLYGAFPHGGQNSRGVIFEWDPLTNIYSRKIDLGASTGVNPRGGLTLHGGKFYGVTTQSFDDNGNQIHSVIFEWDPVNNTYTKKIDLYNTFYSYISAYGLILHNGKFYGTATRNHGSGHWYPALIFEWDPLTNLCVNKIDIEYQYGANLTVKDGVFYGVVPEDPGLIFEWDPTTNIYTKRFDFAPATGTNPVGALILYNNKFYGATELGGANNAGTLFEWDPVTNIYSKIDLSQANGRRPRGRPTLYGGKFYGGTSSGGGYTFGGAIYEWDPTINIYTKKVDLGKLLGCLPGGNLLFKDGKVYGTGRRGDYEGGVIFEWDMVTKKYTQKTNVKLTEGNSPTGRLVLSNQKFYGVTQYGGSDNAGVIFEWEENAGTFTKKYDLITAEGKRPIGGLVDYNGKLYGLCSEGGVFSQGTIFEWDRTTNIYTKKIDLSVSIGSAPDGCLTLKDGKFYGTTQKGGINNAGVIFEWDPATNTYSTKFHFSTPDGITPHGSLVLRKGKFYGSTQKGGANNLGVIFEWDPVTNIYTKKFDFTISDGTDPYSSLTESKGKLYGLTQLGGANNLGVFFEWNPETNVYTKKKDLDGPSGSLPALTDLSLIPAPVTNGLAGSCVNYPTITVDNDNNSDWVSIIDNDGNAIAEIKANGNNLGVVNTSVFINDEAVREDHAKRLYLDRNLTITPQFQPSSPVDIRLYIKNAEYLSLKSALNSIGQTSGVNAIHDIGIFKNPADICSEGLSAGAVPVITAIENWGSDYVLSASITSFSSFYFANKAFTTLPLNLLEFKGRLENKNALLSWKTDNEQNTSHFEIERSTDGVNYRTVGNLSSANAPGLHQYRFTDPSVTSLGAATIYYRLKQVDIGGVFTYSHVVPLTSDEANSISLYPNPISDKATLYISSSKPDQLKIRILDNMGREVKQQSQKLSAGHTTVSIDVAHLSKGLYYLEVKGTTINKQFNFIKP